MCTTLSNWETLCKMVRSPTWSPLGLLLAFCVLVWLEELEALGLEELEALGLEEMEALGWLPEGAGGPGLVGDAGGAGGVWMPGATGGHQANSAYQDPHPLPSQEMSAPLLKISQHQGGGNGCGHGVERLVFWCLPSSLRWMGRLAVPLVLTALVLAEGLGAARTQAPGLAKCQGCLARLC